MSSSVVSFEEKLALVAKVGEISWDGQNFRLLPNTNEGYRMLSLRKGYVRTNQSVVGLIDGAFAHMVSVKQEKQMPVILK